MEKDVQVLAEATTKCFKDIMDCISDYVKKSDYFDTKVAEAILQLIDNQKQLQKQIDSITKFLGLSNGNE